MPTVQGFQGYRQQLQQFFKLLSKISKKLVEKKKEYKDCTECEYKHASTATSATNQPKTLDIPNFSAVAVPKNSATSSATTATKNHDMKGGKQHEAD